jgi:hypothetical protein
MVMLSSALSKPDFILPYDSSITRATSLINSLISAFSAFISNLVLQRRDLGGETRFLSAGPRPFKQLYARGHVK